MFIAISNYLRPLSEVDVHRPEHQAFLKQLLADGKLLTSGRQNPPTGGIIISTIQSRAEFEQLLANDPFAKAGIAKYTIIEFNPSFYHAALEKLFTE